MFFSFYSTGRMMISRWWGVKWVHEGQGQDLEDEDQSLCQPGDYPSTLTTNHLAF
jgi:hypothetical protein